MPYLTKAPLGKLLVFADKGSLHTTRPNSHSFEYASVLNIIVTDYSGEEDAVIAPLLDWMPLHQADLLCNDDKTKGIGWGAVL